MTRTYVVDLVERTTATYLQVFLGLLIADWTDFAAMSDFLDLGTSAAVAAVPAALAVLKGGLARATGDRNSAAMSRPKVRRAD